MLTDPIPALAEQNNFVGYLMGLAGLARAVHALGGDASPADNRREVDDFVHLLLGIARVGDAISRLAESDSDEPLGITRRAYVFRGGHSVVAMSPVLARSDFIRTPVLANARPERFKEWYHFVIHRPGRRILINFSLTSETSRPGGAGLAARVIVIAHDRRWSGAIERFDDELDVSPDLGTLVIGGNQMTVGTDGYRMLIDLPRNDIRGELLLMSVSRPFIVNNQPVGDGRMSWLFVPRMRAHGWLRMGGEEIRFDDDVAYHDHNWGRFQWGGDFGWIWGTILPPIPRRRGRWCSCR